MATSNCNDCTFLQYIPYWLLHYSWHWILLIIYFNWWKASISLDSHRSQPESGPRGQNATHWLKKQGYLHSQTDARCLFIFHLVFLALEPIEGYWILTGWYHLFLPGSRMEVPNEGDWDGHFAKYICMIALLVGIVGFILVGVMLVVSTLVHLCELWAWEPKEESDAGK